MEWTLTASELLRVWERGHSLPLAERAHSLLAANRVSESEQIHRFSIGRRDAELLHLREIMFGPRMIAQTDCPGCHQSVEMDFLVADIYKSGSTTVSETNHAKFGDWELEFRLPSVGDLASLPHEADFASRQQALLSRCICKAMRNGESLPASQLPDDVIEALSECMSELDPGGDVQLALNCPHCGHQWRAFLDIVSFFWSELDAWAGRLLRDVHLLASSYGWREADILAMSPTRRQAYLQMM
jgi:hypothetical protein